MNTKGYPIDSAQSERIAGQGEQLLEDLDVQHDEIGGDSDVVTALPQTPLCVTRGNRGNENDDRKHCLLILLLRRCDYARYVLLQTLENALRQPHVRVADVAALRLNREGDDPCSRAKEEAW